MKPNISRAFTLIELLVVVAIIALLMAILLPSLGKAREQTRRATCAANLHATGNATGIYAADNSDLLPICPLPGQTLNGSGCNWWWDMNIGTPDALVNVTVANANLSAISVRRMFYCPSNTWQNTATEANGTDLWNFTSTTRVIGYPWFGARPSGANLPSPGTQLPAYGGVMLALPPQVWTHMIATPRAAEAVLEADAILSGNNSPSSVTDWTVIQGGFTGGAHTTSHMNGKNPAGGVQQSV